MPAQLMLATRAVISAAPAPHRHAGGARSALANTTRPLAPALLTRRGPLATAPRASDTKVAVPDEVKAEDRPNYLALAAFAASELNKQGLSLPGLPITLSCIYSSLAWIVLTYAALSVALKDFSNDHIGVLVGPVVLAAQALGGIPRLNLNPWQIAAAAFGTLLIKRLPAFQYSTWVWLATLAAAAWKDLAAEWVVAAFGLAAAWRVIKGAQDKVVPLQEVAFAAVAGFAAYRGAYASAALAIFAGHIAASVIGTAQGVAAQLSN